MTVWTGPIACVDAAYGATASAVACVVIEKWADAEACEVKSRRVAGEPEAYAPGEFFKRELPLLLLVLNSISTAISVVVIDGYVWLGADEKPGLGVHLFKLFGVPVIGVAKTKFRDDTWSEKVFRPGSIRPLFVTSIGMATTAATNCIMQIHGNHRIPTILRDVDQTARAALGAPK